MKIIRLALVYLHPAPVRFGGWNGEFEGVVVRTLSCERLVG